MRDSERLARQLMAEEAIEAHAISHHAMRELPEDYCQHSEDDSADYLPVPPCRQREMDVSERSTRHRGMDDSERLARQLLAEEAMEVHAISQRTMLEHAGEYSEEDLHALRAVMAEEAEAIGEEDEDDDYEEDEYEEDPVAEEQEIDYDHLLELGEFMGDVMEERWKERAQSVIASLPTKKYNMRMSGPSTCTICQCEYQNGEELRLLPCACFFHKECGDEWLKRRGTCPNCKRSIDPEAG